MTEFDSLAKFALHLATMEASMLIEEHRGLAEVVRVVAATARAEIGKYQPSAGPFAAWAPLAESTKKDRVHTGYTEDDPGLRDGSMRDSVKGHAAGLEGVVASDDQNLVWFELGTMRQPPRSVLGSAVVANEAVIQRILGRAAVRGLLAGAVLPSGLGYDRDI